MELSKINYLLKEDHMKHEIFMKELPAYTIYYKEGTIRNFSEITDFILASAKECKKDNPNIKCMEPDYCYINYLDGEFKEENIKIRYAQAVEKKGIANETIHFETLNPVTAVCIYHQGDYQNLGVSYGAIMKYIEDNGLEIIESPRERYIDGIWNKKNVEDWLTEIQVPVRKK